MQDFFEEACLTICYKIYLTIRYLTLAMTTNGRLVR